MSAPTKIEITLARTLTDEEKSQVEYILNMGLLDVMCAMRWRESKEMGPPKGKQQASAWFEALALLMKAGSVRITEGERQCLTVEHLAQLLSDSFEADEWGYIESDLFKGIIDANYVGGADFTRDVTGLREVLARVVDTLNRGAR